MEISIVEANGIHQNHVEKRKKEKLLIMNEQFLYPLKEAVDRDVLELVRWRPPSSVPGTSPVSGTRIYTIVS